MTAELDYTSLADLTPETPSDGPETINRDLTAGFPTGDDFGAVREPGPQDDKSAARDRATAASDARLEASRTANAPAKRRHGKATPKPPARALAWRCQRCDKLVRGTGIGFAYVDLREASAALQGRLRGPDGQPIKATWRIAHAKCAPDITKPLSAHSMVWCDKMGDTDTMLNTIAEMNRAPWFAGTDWGALIRTAMAETEFYETETTQRSADHRAARERRKAEGLPPGDPRHGTETGYNTWGCRCQPCTINWATHGRVSRTKVKTAVAQADQIRADIDAGGLVELDTVIG